MLNLPYIMMLDLNLIIKMYRISFRGEENILDVIYDNETKLFTLSCGFSITICIIGDTIRKYFAHLFTEDELNLILHIISKEWKYEKGYHHSLHYDVRVKDGFP